jgi:copper chaperone CopZ
MFKKIIISIFTLILLSTFIALAGENKTEKLTLEVKDMHCDDCANTIQKTLLKIDGVKEVKTDLNAKTVYVEFASNKIDAVKIQKVIFDAGFKSENCETDIKANGCCAKKPVKKGTYPAQKL